LLEVDMVLQALVSKCLQFRSLMPSGQQYGPTKCYWVIQ
jgi:hypothetical protein